MQVSTSLPIPRGSSRFPVTPRWGGHQPDFSPQRERGLAQLRAWEAARRAAAAPDPERCMGGTELRELAARGKAYGCPLKRPDGAELGRMRLRDVHLAALAWVFAAEVGFGREALLVRHADMAALLGCSERTAGTVMRHPAGLGLVTALPMYLRGGAGHAQLPCAYRVSELARRLFRVRPVGGGKICQPSEIPASRDPEVVESPVGDGSIGVPDASTEANATRVKPRTDAPRAPDGEGPDVPVRGARQLARMLLAEQAKLAARIERDLRRTWQRERVASLQAAAAEKRELLAWLGQRGAAAAPPPVVFDPEDAHPDDVAAWEAYRRGSQGRRGAARDAAPEPDDLEAVLASARASFERHRGGASS